MFCADIREKPTTGKTHVLTYEAFKKYCKGCTFLMKTETHPQVVIVECNLDGCLYFRYEEMWKNSTFHPELERVKRE